MFEKTRTGYWYKAECKVAHQGAGSRSATTEGNLYIFANDIISALNRYKKIPGIHRSQIPSIRKLSEQESQDLEIKIDEERRIDLSRAKRTWYKEFAIGNY